jgi:hypothetical protein
MRSINTCCWQVTPRFGCQSAARQDDALAKVREFTQSAGDVCRAHNWYAGLPECFARVAISLLTTVTGWTLWIVYCRLDASRRL